MAVTKLKGFNHNKWCIVCKKQAKLDVRFKSLTGYYCKKCYKKWCTRRKLEKKNEHVKKRPFSPKSKNSLKSKQKTVTKRVLNLRRRATPAELCFLKKLKKVCPVKFKFQRGFIKGGYYAIVDFHIPSRKLCIEIDGGYHDNPEQQKKDTRRDNWLRDRRKQRVIRITNQRAFDITPEEVKGLIAIVRL